MCVCVCVCVCMCVCMCVLKMEYSRTEKDMVSDSFKRSS